MYIEALSSSPAGTIIADLGCGDAALARALLPKGLVVLSYDLVSDNSFVVATDICHRIPLPGSEPTGTEKSDGEAQIVDVAVCALSLMGTNWPICIREAWRILRHGYAASEQSQTSAYRFQWSTQDRGSCQSVCQCQAVYRLDCSHGFLPHIEGLPA